MVFPKLSTARSNYGGRGYYLPGHITSEGKRVIYPSVTTCLKTVAKDGLHQWIADQVASFAVVNIPYLMSQSEEVGWRFLRFYWSREPELVGSELRLHHEGVRDDAAELGTNEHEIIEAILDGTVRVPDAESIEAEEMLEQFMHWLSRHAVTSHTSEFTLWNSRLDVVGTADADWTIQCLHDGEPCIRVNGIDGITTDWVDSKAQPIRCLVDLKTSRHTWPEHGMQLACLNDADTRMVEVPESFPGCMLHEATVDGVKQRSWWVEVPAQKFDAQILLHLRPSDLDTKGEIIDPFCKVIDLTEDIPLYLSGFEGALALTNMKYNLKQRATARKQKVEA